MADPDYASYNSEVERNEEEERKGALVKVRSIITEEFDKELEKREKNLCDIESQICSVQKLLHTLRYVIVSSYYKRDHLEINVPQEERTNFTILDAQNRLHPAVKKLLNVRHWTSHDNEELQQKFNQLGRDGIRRAKMKLYKHEPPEKKSKYPERYYDSVEKDKSGTCLKLSKDLPPKEAVPIVKNPIIENGSIRKRIKRRIIIGNTSKWVASSEEDDEACYKWMIYVRRPRETTDINDIIEKIVFYLHPTYKPFDVVEITAPFQLVRKGWGEFPIKLQIFFKAKLNKPIEIIHNLKLDRERTGREVIGRETIIDVFLYTHLCGENEDSSKLEMLQIENGHPLIEQTSPNEKHDLLSAIYYEHSYIKSPLKLCADFEEKYKIIVRELYGITEEFVTFSQRKYSTDYAIPIPVNAFKNMGEILPYIFRRLSLYADGNNSAPLPNYYPYAASSLTVFKSWNIGRQLNNEWQRAKIIKKIVLNAEIPAASEWSTKSILMYGRSHFYTPFFHKGISQLFEKDSFEKNLLLTCHSMRPKSTFTPFGTDLQCPNNNNKSGKARKQEFCGEIDVTTIDSNECNGNINKFKDIVDISDPNYRPHCSFVRQTALNCGILLKPELVDDKFRFNGAERMIFEAIRCLSDNLVRRAANHNICRNTEPETEFVTIGVDDITAVLEERQDLKKISRFREQRKLKEYYYY